MKGAIVVVLLAGMALPIRAEELRAVDPKTVIDGDTFYVSVRLLSVDAPEQGDRAKCDRERALAKRAKERVKELLQGRVTLDVAGVDEFGRLLADVQLANGRSLGQVLVEEALARPYQEGRRPDWC